MSQNRMHIWSKTTLWYNFLSEELHVDWFDICRSQPIPWNIIKHFLFNLFLMSRIILLKYTSPYEIIFQKQSLCDALRFDIHHLYVKMLNWLIRYMFQTEVCFYALEKWFNYSLHDNCKDWSEASGSTCSSIY